MPEVTVIDYLEQLQRKGITHVEVDDQAREILREFYRRGAAQPAQSTSSPSTTQTQAPSPEAVPSPTPATTEIKATGNNAAEKISSLKTLCEQWQPARNLGTLRDIMVFSTGNPEAELMLVGEAPGYQEERQREPFIGPAGQKLDAILKAMGLSRPEIYISNVCKFRPAIKNQTTGNRKPSPEEMASTISFLRAEIDVVKPSVIIALGATAAEGLLESNQPVGRLRGEWHQFQGIPLRVTFHPSYLLHKQEGLSEKRKVWEDMLAVMEKMKLPISEKQKGYFLPK